MPRTYACPICGKKLQRSKFLNHIESKHEDSDEIPENITAYQFAYDIINNHPNHKGVCCVCSAETNFNPKTQKYFRICKKESCRQAIQKTYHERMMKVYNKPHLMDDVNHLEKMLASRKISGKYKWSDGTEFTYTGTYEKNFLEFLDKVMNYESREIISPGPVLEYDYKGKKHKWITDVMILPYNLIVEIKDGGDNKNGNQAWKGTREKTIAKEVMITNLGKYNYIRLTNNDFAQFLGIIAELKMQIVDDTVSPLYRIHENASLDEGFIKNVVISTINGIRKVGNTIEGLKKKQQATSTLNTPNPYKIEFDKNVIRIKNTIVQMKPSDGFDFGECMALAKAINSISEDKLIKYLDKYGGYTLKELLEDYNQSCDIPVKNFFKGKKVTKTIGNEGEFDLYFYCHNTKKWYMFHHEDEPLIDINNGMDYNTMKNEFKKSYSSDDPLEEETIPELIDNPYMLREAQEWEHLTHMWDNAIDDIIGNVTNSPFEVAKGSYIDHDPETGKEVCVMRTIRPKEELKNREYRDKLKRQMYKLQQKINKAYNVHPSVMFIQYPIDNTNLTEGLIIGITKTSR